MATLGAELIQMRETLVALGLGTERWRVQTKARVRRLSKRWRRQQLATA